MMTFNEWWIENDYDPHIYNEMQAAWDAGKTSTEKHLTYYQNKMADFLQDLPIEMGYLTYELEKSQAREKLLREALEALQSNGRKQGWNDRYEADMHAAYAALNQPTDDTALKTAVQRGIAEFLEHTGQYVTNDASRKAALTAERERCREAIRALEDE
jgi:hypothetical protein